MDMDWKPTPVYDQCMDCDVMMSGPEAGQVPAEVERIGDPLPKGVSPRQANWIEYGPEGGRYQSNGTPGARENVSHKLCPQCAETRHTWVENRRRELAEQREREEQEERERRNAQRRFKRGRKDKAE